MSNTRWTEKDNAAIKAIIVNILNQKTMLFDLSQKKLFHDAFNLDNANDFGLGIFTGIVINLFANYWINEHEEGLLVEDIDYLHQEIINYKNLILESLSNSK